MHIVCVQIERKIADGSGGDRQMGQVGVGVCGVREWKSVVGEFGRDIWMRQDEGGDEIAALSALGWSWRLGFPRLGSVFRPLSILPV